MVTNVLDYIRKHNLLKAGDRVGVAVSGGADSVALLLALIDLQTELGIRLSVVHFNHKIRGADADADAAFVAELAKQRNLEFHLGCGDAPARVRGTKESLETAARELRYGYFRELLTSGIVNKIATAHTMDDQAESVLMRFLRGAGTRGLAGIYPEKNEAAGQIIRPLLGVRRAQVEAFLHSRDQSWREDATNIDTVHTRNKVRHELLPALRDFNPAIVETLARTAEVARAEEDFWDAEVPRLLPMVLLPGKAARGGGRAVSQEKKTSGLSIEALNRQPLALQRRLIRAAAETLGVPLDLHHIEEVLSVAAGVSKGCELPEGWRVYRSFRELRFERSRKPPKAEKRDKEYEYALPVSGQTLVPDVNLLVRALLLPIAEDGPAYNHGNLPDRLLANRADNVQRAESKPAKDKGLELLCGENAKQLHLLASVQGDLKVRNWRPGDRFRPAHCGSEKKVKDLLQELKVPQTDRQSWPLVTADDTVIWMRGTRPLKLWVADGQKLRRLVIEEEETKTATEEGSNQGGMSEE